MAMVSVIVPTRNRAALLGHTLRSICAQQAVDLEVLVVDDGDGPETAAVVDSLGDSRVQLVRNGGQRGECGARNSGVAMARREWIAFCDDDDLWAPGKLAAQLSAVVDDGAAWVYAGDVTVNADLRVLSGSPPPTPDEVLRDLPRHNAVPAGSSNVLVHADALARAGPFDAALRTIGDWDMWLRLTRTAGRPAWVCRPLVAYRFHSMNIATDVGNMVTEPQQLVRRYGIPVDFAAMHCRAAWTALRAGRRGEAIRHYARAVARGDLPSLARAAFALVHPAVGSDAMFGLVRRDPSWVADAERWLAAFSEPVSARPAGVTQGGRR